MASDVRFDGDTVDIDGTAIFSGKIISTQSEITSYGSVAGFSFQDRSDFLPVDSPGHRYVWYCQDQQARLWSGSDLVTIGKKNNQATMTVGGVELVAAVKSLQKTVGYLQSEIDELRKKVGLPVIDWTKLINLPVGQTLNHAPATDPALHHIPGVDHGGQ